MRIRISYKKGIQIRYTSTLDLQSIWQHVMRRAKINVEYSQGFHPQPRIQLGVPLPLGCVSLDEKVDIWIEGTLLIDEIINNLYGKLPEGMIITKIEEILMSEKPLSAQIQYSDYNIYILKKDFSVETIQNNIDVLINEKEIIRTKRNGKKYDLRPLILAVNLSPKNDIRPSLFMRLLSQSNKTGRADEVMFALDFSITDFLVERIGSFT